MTLRMLTMMRMKPVVMWLCVMGCACAWVSGAVKVDEEVFGKSLGGWKKRGNKAAEYPLSGSIYRTYKPEITPTPEGGLFVSVRIDHVRGWLASDDHAVLEITVDGKGSIISAQSNIAIQGRSITSDVILGVNEAGKQLAGPDRAVQIGTDLIANLSTKLLRENIVEAGRVSFPAVLRHNYNLLFQAIRQEMADEKAAPVVSGDPAKPATPAAESPVKPAAKSPILPVPEKSPIGSSPENRKGEVVPKSNDNQPVVPHEPAPKASIVPPHSEVLDH